MQSLPRPRSRRAQRPDQFDDLAMALVGPLVHALQELAEVRGHAFFHAADKRPRGFTVLPCRVGQEGSEDRRKQPGRAQRPSQEFPEGHPVLPIDSSIVADSGLSAWMSPIGVTAKRMPSRRAASSVQPSARTMAGPLSGERLSCPIAMSSWLDTRSSAGFGSSPRVR